MPEEEFPHVNDAESFGDRLVVLRKQALGRVVMRWAPVFGVVVAIGVGVRWRRR